MLMGIHGPGPGKIQRVFPNGMPIVPTDPADKLTSKVKAAFEPIVAAGQIPFGSFKLSPPNNSGWNADLDMLAEYLQDLDSEVYMTVWHEPENDMDAPTFVDIYTRCYLRLKNAVGAKLKFGPVAMAYQWVPGRVVASPAAWLPSQADFYGVDVYSHTPVASAGSLIGHAGYARWETALDAKNIPAYKIFVVERGFDLPDADQVDTLNSDYAYLKALGAGGYMVWNVDADGHQYTLGANATAQYAELVAAESGAYTQADLDAANLAGYRQGLADAEAAVAALAT